MKTYDEITDNVLEGAKIYRRKLRRTQCAVSVVAMSTACALGLTLYSNIEKVDRSQPEQPTDCYTEYASNLPTMNASNDPENGDILSSEPPTPTEVISPEISPSAPSTSITATATAPPPSTDPKEATVPETMETTAIPETEPIHTTAVVIATTAPPIATTAPPVQTTAVHTTAVPVITTEAILETAEYIEPTEAPTEWVEIEIIEETNPPAEPEPEEPTEPKEPPTEEPTEPPTEAEEPMEESTELPADSTEPTEEPTISELEALKEAYPDLQLSDEEWEVLFTLYGDSEMPFSFWYTMFEGNN